MKKNTLIFSCLLSIMILFASVGGTYATWLFAGKGSEPNGNGFYLSISEFDYTPPMTDGEVLLLRRMDDVLNNNYTTETIKDSRKYLIEETIKVTWEEYAPPYVGSMDEDYKTQIHELFGDIIDFLGVSFILKNQDLNWDGYNEISCYSTSDPLDCCELGYNGVVAVYLTVFTPIVENYNIVGYQLVCDSLYGFCNEIYYNPIDQTVSSFSTEDWRDNLTYWHHINGSQLVPDDAVGWDGVSLFKYHYDSYHEGKYWYPDYPWPVLNDRNVWVEGRRASEVLADKIPWIPSPWG